MVEETGWWRRKSLAARPERPDPDVVLIAKSDARARSALKPEDAAIRRHMTMAMFLMSGRPFKPQRVDVSAHADDLELCEVENVGTMDHPFHTHTWYFQVISRSGRPEPFRAWRDMVNLRPGERVKLLLPLRTYTGRSFCHCHITEHGDQGMMAVLEVR
jgi:FtsP/CotA-like multicopper oxidase with cupredoxin domain